MFSHGLPRLVLQQLLSNRLVAIIGLIMSIVATLLMGDWQATRHDPCTQASLFHHPELLHTYTVQLDRPTAPEGSAIDDVMSGIECERLNLSLSLQQHLKTRTMDVYVYPHIVTSDVMVGGCVEVESCPQCSVDGNGVYQTYLASPTCLHLQINSQQHCLETAPSSSLQLEPHPLLASYSCTMPKSQFTYCLTACPQYTTAEDEYAFIQEDEYVSDVHVQSVRIVEGHMDALAAQSCEQHSGEHHCHWNPRSSVTHKQCEDCPPICRDHTNYLEFAQFTIAAAILLISVPVARVPITSLISDIVSSEEQVYTQSLDPDTVTE